MKTVPVAQTATAAYEFAFKNYVRLLGVIWVPMVLMFALMAVTFFPALTQMQAAEAAKDPAAILAVAGSLFLADAIVLLLFVSLSVGITEIALGRTVRFPYFHLSIGAAFWRLLLSSFILVLIMFVAIFAMSIVMGIIVGVIATSSAGTEADQAQVTAQVGKMSLLVVIPVYAAMFLIMARFGVMLPSISVVEKSIGIGRNWTLSKGNTWRIVGVIVLILLPLVVVGFIGIYLLGVIGGPGLNMFQSFGNPRAQMTFSTNMLHFYVTYWYLLLPISFLLAPIMYGAIVGGGAFVYRTLVPEAVPADTF